MLFLRKNSNTPFLSLLAIRWQAGDLEPSPCCPNSRLVGRMIPALWGASTSGTDYSRAGGVLGQQLSSSFLLLPFPDHSRNNISLGQFLHCDWGVISEIWSLVSYNFPMIFVNGRNPQWMNPFLGRGTSCLESRASIPTNIPSTPACK